MNKKGYITESGGRQNGFAIEPEINPISEGESKKSIFLFNRKSKFGEDNLPVKKKGLFGRKKEVIKEEIKPKKKGWFK